MMMGAMLLALTLAGGQAGAAKDNGTTITTRVPSAHVQAYMTRCGKEWPQASCWCVVEKLNATKEGQFVLDMLGISILGSVSKSSVLATVNRHGLRATQAKAILERSEAIAKAAEASCG